MQIVKLYRYERECGGITVTPEKPDNVYTLLYRLVADEGKVLTDGKIVTACVDVESAEGWTEIDNCESMNK